MNIDEKVRQIVCGAINEEPKELKSDASLVEEYHIDSMMALGIMVALEREFKIYIPEEDIAEFDTLEDIISLTKEHIETSKNNKEK
jgi:acyl carrier protein